MVIFKAITFVESGKQAEGYFFYDAANDSQYGKIFGVKGLTLPKAIQLMQSIGVDPIKNSKLNIAVYYH